MDPQRRRAGRGNPTCPPRRSFDAGGRCFEVARDLYRGDRAELRIDAEIPATDRESDPAGLVSLRRGRAGEPA